MRARLNALMPQGSFLRNVSILTGGTVFAQGLMVLALPILTRLYTPEDFNLLAVYVSVLGLVTVVSCLRYNIAIPLPEDDADGMALLVVSVLAALVISLLCALPVFLAHEASATLLGQPHLTPYLWMIPVGILIASLYNALQYWASRKKRFVQVTKTRVTRAIGGVGTQLGFGVTSPSPFGLLFGQMLAEGLGILRLAIDLVKSDGERLRSISIRASLRQAVLYRRFPLFSVPEALFNAAASHLPLILIAASATGPEAAFLFLAMRVMGIPMRLIGSSVSQVFLVEAPKKHREGQLRAFTTRTIVSFLKVGGLPLLAIGLASPFAFPIVFGDEWTRAGILVLWMTPWFLMQFVTSPVSVVLQVTGHLMLAFWLQVIGFLLRVGAVVVALNFSVDAISEIFAVSGFLFYCLYFIVVRKVIDTPNSEAVR